MKTLKNDNDVNTRVGKRKKRGKTTRIFWGILAALLVGIAGFAYYEYHTVKNAADSAYKSGGISSAENGSKNSVISSSKPIAILLNGDRHRGFGENLQGTDRLDHGRGLESKDQEDDSGQLRKRPAGQLA
ncbi:hypothetical protein NRIC0767_02120 [Lactobacillus delbrueckii subsp. allosunkii]|nr:hypothetical protein NRIC0766_11380 [Lactobacillus delbrueckii subsp. sunkii]GHN13951.1 hypothetical protein NRIC0767_02120 [Lactobacillus delbrueckii subsp. sunkii]